MRYQGFGLGAAGLPTQLQAVVGRQPAPQRLKRADDLPAGVHAAQVRLPAQRQRVIGRADPVRGQLPVGLQQLLALHPHAELPVGELLRDAVDMGAVQANPADVAGGHRLDRDFAARDREELDLQARGGLEGFLERLHLALQRLQPVDVGDGRADRVLRSHRGGDGKAGGQKARCKEAVHGMVPPEAAIRPRSKPQ
ncbi:MAG: hypothetical protein ACK40I_04710 [Tabrizicola sp.]